MHGVEEDELLNLETYGAMIDTQTPVPH